MPCNRCGGKIFSGEGDRFNLRHRWHTDEALPDGVWIPTTERCVCGGWIGAGEGDASMGCHKGHRDTRLFRQAIRKATTSFVQIPRLRRLAFRRRRTRIASVK
jgi:hypothetical protein